MLSAQAFVVGLALLAPIVYAGKPQCPCNPQPTVTASSFPQPSADPFYSIPHNIDCYANGQVIRSRGVANTTLFGNAVDTRQIFYRTTNRLGHATGTVTTVFSPPAPADPPRLLSYQNPEDALALRCSPSFVITNFSSQQETYLSPLLSVFATWSLEQGYYFVTSDDLDRDSAWLVGTTEGRAVLDGIHAATSSLCLHSPAVGLVGYSGGAHESISALNQEAEGYATDVNVVGAAFGGTPVDIKKTYELQDGHPSAVLALGSLLGLSKEYPKLRETLDRLATAKGKEYIAEMLGKDACLVAGKNPLDFFNVTFSSPAVFKGGNIQDNPVVNAVLSRESLLQNINPGEVPVPKVPRFEWHGNADTIVPYEPEVEYVKQQCAAGADIRFDTIPGEDHNPSGLIGIPAAALFIQEAFNGTIPAAQCGSPIPIPALNSSEALAILGPNVLAIIEEIIKESASTST